MKTALMKKFPAWLAIVILALVTTTAQAQSGYITFRNYLSCNFITNGVTLQKVTGANYKVTHYYGPSAGSLSAAATNIFSGTGLIVGGTIPLAPYLEGDTAYS